ncbi:Co2+/Mg2+ efflux protein ApaG [Lampropedia puyangensis]|uniref:Protein ApaG n=1 Tax=Lampropedia puyangensis TaxID=1330072 RepID=A0A4S8F507_9BURK|nr:Co2+/Mg2+ efflux protein ApaG [Lampropedia puyangensis]THU00292.1 Co2+/Mg2+ efflux protein ApaG [Lampropedia puyangensis]
MQHPTLHVDVHTHYLPHQSSPAQSQYRFAYTVRITNQGAQAAQIIARHWWIEDANNRTEQVRGLGIVGEQPLLEPGETYEYTSGCALQTPQGQMRGHYLCVTDEGDVFECAIAPFEFNTTAQDNVAEIHSPNQEARVLH